MFIEVREQGSKKKYYLAHSFRDRGKIKKIRRYLGSNLSKKKLKELRNRAEILIIEQIKSYKEIKDPFKYVLSREDLNILKGLDIKKTIKVQHLSEEDWLNFTERFAYDTNAIEGSTITYSEVEQIIERNKWPEDASKAEVSETYGVADAIKYIRKTKTHISIKLIKELHKIVFKNSKPFAGKIRPKGIEVGVKDKFGNIVHRGASSTKVIEFLKELIKWYNKSKNKYPPLVLAVVIHNQFEEIHPFQDGNGRVGRLLLNNVLIKHYLPPVNIQLSHRRGYYAALQEYHKKGDIMPMIELILKECKSLKGR